MHDPAYLSVRHARRVEDAKVAETEESNHILGLPADGPAVFLVNDEVLEPKLLRVELATLELEVPELAKVNLRGLVVLT